MGNATVGGNKIMVQTFLRIATTALIFAALVAILFLFPFSFPDISPVVNVVGFVLFPISIITFYFPAFLPLFQFAFGVALFFLSYFVAKWVLLALHWVRGAL